MATPTQPLRDEHKELLPYIERLGDTADLVGDTPVIALRREVDELYNFLQLNLLPHAQAEEQILYPVVANVMGAAEATVTMSYDHEAISELIAELSALRQELYGTYLPPSLAKSLRRVLYGLYALVKIHFVKEEELYLPLLDDNLTAVEARELFAAMEQAAEEARRHPSFA
jgi:iron-sulfur cluster repair protein YtfE (RIC family)